MMIRNVTYVCVASFMLCHPNALVLNLAIQGYFYFGDAFTLALYRMTAMFNLNLSQELAAGHAYFFAVFVLGFFNRMCVILPLLKAIFVQ